MCPLVSTGQFFKGAESKMSAKVFKLLETVSKKDRIVAALKEAIISGEASPGDPIIEAKVAQQLGVGQPIVREALIELEHQGFVRRLAYRGTYVTKLSREEIEQIFSLRLELEALAVKWAKQNAKPAEIETLRKFVVGMREAAHDLDLAKFYENDLAFHQKLWALSGNKYLVESLERIVIPLFAFFLMKTARIRESYVESADMHEKTVDALLSTETTDVHGLQREIMGTFKDEWLTKLLPKED